MQRLAALAIIAMTLAAPSAHALEQTGPARVVDGDTLEITGLKIRLDGIDAPESGQTCRASDGRDWRCGEAATDALRAMIAGADVTCAGDAVDGYDRLIATCSVAGRNLNAALVREGWALAFRRYSERYVPEEAEAAAARRAMWAGEFVAPWDFRANRWTASASVAPHADCPIKGNISANGRIYHTPYSRHYDRTKIDTSRGERWFCSEREALDAGWRAPLG